MKTSVLAIASFAVAVLHAGVEKSSLDGECMFRREGGAWRTVMVPHDWSIETAPAEGNPTGKEWGFYEAGKGEYRRTFMLGDADIGRRLELAFDGVLRNAEVSVNGSAPFKGTRYGYTGFRVPLDGIAKAGTNEVVVKVDNSALPGSRWYMGSGIFRSVRLEKRDWPYVEPGSIDVRTTLDGHVSLTGTLVEKDGTRKDVKKEFAVANPILWTPETPKLYEAEFFGEKIRYGIRTIEASAGKGFLLNGKMVKLHGACVHHDHGPLGAASWPEAELRKARQLKAAGFNAVRTSHNPMSEAFISACDEVGLLVVDDMFDGRERKKTDGDYCEVFNEDWKKDTAWIVRRDRVHPSVVMWSVGNEILERSEPFAAETTKAMHAFIDGLDGTRPTTQALCLWNNQKWEDQDAMAANLDVVGYNYLENLTESDHARLPNRVIMYTETFPRDAAAVWARIVKHPYVLGEFVWTGIDYLGETGIGRNFYADREKPGEHWVDIPQFPWHGAYCGDIDLTGWRKPISHYRETLWNPNAKTCLAVREPDGWKGKIATTLWSVWPTHDHWSFAGWEGKEIAVEVYTRQPKVALYLNGKLIGEKDVGEKVAWKAEFKLPYAPGELKAVAGEEVAVLRTAGEPKEVRYTTEKIGRLAWVTAEVVDAKGTVCPYADREVSFEGNVLGTCSGDLSDNVPAPSRTRKTFMGRAMAVVFSN